jgi:hypothetical protein
MAGARDWHEGGGGGSGSVALWGVFDRLKNLPILFPTQDSNNNNNTIASAEKSKGMSLPFSCIRCFLVGFFERNCCSVDCIRCRQEEEEDDDEQEEQEQLWSGSIALCNCFLSLQQEACSSSWQPAARSLMTEEEASLQPVVHFPEVCTGT